jgi:hypothetical protein
VVLIISGLFYAWFAIVFVADRAAVGVRVGRALSAHPPWLNIQSALTHIK